jgi:hypothetical protein
MTGLGDQLAALTATRATEPSAERRPVPAAPKGWEPGVAYDPSGAMTVTTTATCLVDQHDSTAWHALVEELGVKVPPGWRIRLVEAKFDPVAWTRDSPEQDKAVTRPAWRYRFAVEPCAANLDIEELVKRVRKHKTPTERISGTAAYVVAMGDTQIGKVDGGGPDATVDRILESIEAQKARLRELRRIGRPLGDVYLAWLGDCIEGFVSQGGANAWRTTLTLTEQVRIVRRLMLHQVEEFRSLADRIVLLSIPGNHDEAIRFGKGGVTRYDDSWAVEAAVQVGDALAMNKEAYGHVSVAVPGRDELTLTLDVAGTRTGFAHGHQWRPGKGQVWWAEQAHGMQPIGEASLLLSAHLHHLAVTQGGAKTHVQVPAFECESTWWRHQHGQVAPAGAVTMAVGSGGWGDLVVV